MTELHHVNEAGDRREESRFRLRAALMRLRLAEDAAVRQLPTADATELAHAIQGVVDLIRTQEGAT